MPAKQLSKRCTQMVMRNGAASAELSEATPKEQHMELDTRISRTDAEMSIAIKELITCREMWVEGLIMESEESSEVELIKTEVFAGLMTASVGKSRGRRVLL